MKFGKSGASFVEMSTPSAAGGGGKTGRRRRPSSKCSTHRSSPRAKPQPASPQDATRFVVCNLSHGQLKLPHSVIRLEVQLD